MTTMAIKESESPATRVPNSWQYTSNGFVPLEYSTDPMALGDSSLTENHTAFLDDFSRELQKHNATELLGPCLIRRNFFGTRRNSNEDILVETTDESRRANILKFDHPDKYVDKNLIQTSWLAVEKELLEASTSSCTPFCSPGACVPHTVCVSDGSGGHTSNSHHSSSHHSGHG